MELIAGLAHKHGRNLYSAHVVLFREMLHVTCSNIRNTSRSQRSY